MSVVNFIDLCESVLNEAELKESLMLLEAEIQKQSRFDQIVTKIAQKVQEAVQGELERGRKTARPELVQAGRQNLINLRARLVKLLNASRQKAAMIKKVTAVPYTKTEVDNFILKYVERGGAFETFGKILSNQFGEEELPPA